MKKLRSLIVVGFALVLGAAAVAHADPRDGRRFDRDPRAVAPHRGFDGPRHFEAPRFGGHRRFIHGHGRAFLGAAPFLAVAPFSPYWYAPPPPAAYWYYCPSVGAYYPTVQSCPVAWVPVPAQ